LIIPANQVNNFVNWLANNLNKPGERLTEQQNEEKDQQA